MTKVSKNRDAPYWVHSDPDAGDGQTCTSCRKVPTTAKLCTECELKLENALAALASWHEPPPPINRRMPVDDRGRILNPGQEARRQRSDLHDAKGRDVDRHPPRGYAPDRDPRHGRRPSSPFDDMPSVAAMRGGTLGHAGELDTPSIHVRAIMVRSPRPYRAAGVGKAEHDLTAAVITWIARLAGAGTVAPRTVVTGHALARGCTFLLWHAHDIATHPDAADAVTAFTNVAKRIRGLADPRGPVKEYVGPCWTVTDIAYCTIEDRVEYLAEVECPADMYAEEGSTVVTCRACGAVHEAASRIDWFSVHAGEQLLTAKEMSGALGRFGQQVAEGTIRVWADRGRLTAHGNRLVGKRTYPVYRVDQVLELALARPDDGRRAKVG